MGAVRHVLASSTASRLAFGRLNAAWRRLRSRRTATCRQAVTIPCMVLALASAFLDDSNLFAESSIAPPVLELISWLA